MIYYLQVFEKIMNIKLEYLFFKFNNLKKEEFSNEKVSGFF